jgi:hypothetical protein
MQDIYINSHGRTAYLVDELITAKGLTPTDDTVWLAQTSGTSSEVCSNISFLFFNEAGALDKTRNPAYLLQPFIKPLFF